MDEVENFFCQFPNPWALRVSGMGGYTSKCEKSQNHCTPTVQLLRSSSEHRALHLARRHHQVANLPETERAHGCPAIGGRAHGLRGHRSSLLHRYKFRQQRRPSMPSFVTIIPQSQRICYCLKKKQILKVADMSICQKDNIAGPCGWEGDHTIPCSAAKHTDWPLHSKLP